jgi:hypothetical protein
MIPPFADHPAVREYNSLKKYFRQHETRESRSRIHEFRGYVRLISAAGLTVAFDFVGSLNFGQAVLSSDVDCVIYFRCPDHGAENCGPDCRMRAGIGDFLTGTLAPRLSHHPYNIEIIDFLNLDQLDREIKRGAADSETLLTFAFYRSIGRSVNARLLREYQARLLANRNLVDSLQPQLWSIFDELGRSSHHNMSFKKYQERVTESGGEISPGVRDSIRRLLDQYFATRGADGGETSGGIVG